MLVSKAIGDALGARFEMKPAAFVTKYNTGLDYPRVLIERAKLIQPDLVTTKRLPIRAKYTDDTQMEIGTVELILSGKPFKQMTQLDLATAMFIAYKRDPRKGYARGFQGVLDEVNTPTELLHALWPHSARNGAAMRASSWGVLPDEGQVIDMAMWQASLTHATQEGFLSAAAAALMVHAMWYRKCDRYDLEIYLNKWLPLPPHLNPNPDSTVDVELGWASTHEGPVPMSGISTVMAAITALLGPVTEDDQKGPDTMQDLLTSCIAFTGDVDTVAAIAMPVGALCPDIEKNLPQALYDGLENGEYGLDYLKTLDQELLAIFPRPGTEVEIDPSKLSLTDDATDDADELLDFDALMGDD